MPPTPPSCRAYRRNPSRLIVVPAKDGSLRARDEGVMSHARFVPFTPKLRMSSPD